MADNDNQITIIGRDAKIKGELSFDASAKILGTFEGKIIAKGEVVIGETATCRATVEAGNVIVDGPLEGDVIARDRLQLTAKARVKGDITAGSLSVVEGASFVGHCKVGPEAVKLADELGHDLEIKTGRKTTTNTTPIGTPNATNGASWLAGTRSE